MAERVRSIFQLQIICRTQPANALHVIRDALSEAGVYVTEIRHLSNKATVLHVLLNSERWSNMLTALSGTGMSPDPQDAGYPVSLKVDKDGDIFGTIQVLYVSDEPDAKDVIPFVPG